MELGGLLLLASKDGEKGKMNKSECKEYGRLVGNILVDVWHNGV